MEDYKKFITQCKPDKTTGIVGKSCRPQNFENKDKQVKKIVWRGLALFFIIYFIYLLFLSKYFLITNIKIEVNNPQFNTEELANYVRETLNKKFLSILHRNNYWLFSYNYLTKELTKKYLIEELKIQKVYPDSLTINFKEKIANLIYQTNNQLYIIDLNGKINSSIGDRIILNEKNLPKIIDESNNPVVLDQNILTPSLIQLTVDIFENFSNFCPSLVINDFKITNSTSTYVKIGLKDGPQVEVNDRLSITEQLNKLKRIIDEAVIDLKKVTTINLRIKEQIIYK